MRLGLLAALLLLCTTSVAVAAGSVVVVFDSKREEYRVAAMAARAQLKTPPEMMDISNGAPVNSAPSIVIAVGSDGLAYAQRTYGNAFIVYTTVLNPERFAADKMTGVAWDVPVERQLETFRTVLPKARRFGVIHSSEQASFIKHATTIAKKLGVELVARQVSAPREVAGAFDEIGASIDALWFTADPKLSNKDVFAYLLRTTLDRGVPLFGFRESLTQAGALASHSPDYEEMGRLAGDLAQQILRDGKAPDQVYGSGVLSINVKTAHRLGVDVDLPALKNARRY